MRLCQLDAASIPSGACNEDRIGQRGAYTWAIDGATDIAAERILPGTSDAAWLADLIDGAMHRLAPLGVALEEAVATASGEAARRFAEERLREPRERHELPSAAGLIARLEGSTLEWLSLGDCSLLLEAPDGRVHVAAGGHQSAGDRSTAEAIRALQGAGGAVKAAAVRSALTPRLRSSRAGLNRPGGYGVFSVVPVPPEFMRRERLPVESGSHLLLASDGFMRLADPYARHSLQDLVLRARREGLTAMIAELREIEAADPDCVRFARAKPSDDASALLLAVE